MPRGMRQRSLKLGSVDTLRRSLHHCLCGHHERNSGVAARTGSGTGQQRNRRQSKSRHRRHADGPKIIGGAHLAARRARCILLKRNLTAENQAAAVSQVELDLKREIRDTVRLGQFQSVDEGFSEITRSGGPQDRWALSTLARSAERRHCHADVQSSDRLRP